MRTDSVLEYLEYLPMALPCLLELFLQDRSLFYSLLLLEATCEYLRGTISFRFAEIFFVA